MTTIFLSDHADSVPVVADGIAATIGFFDGVHRGHLHLIAQLREQAVRRSMPTMVITFDRHPRQVLQSEWQPQLLTTLDEKLQLLARAGIDYAVVLTFDTQMAALTARDFMQQVLYGRLGVRLLLTGYDNRFGRRTADGEGFDDYVAYGQQMGMEVVAGLPLIDDGQAVSSSLVRRLLAQGLVGQAAACLGRDYTLSGTVVHGLQNGRQIGFPTANLSVDPSRVVPASGVYAVRVQTAPAAPLLPGMTNIGIRPTFGGHEQTIETHILDFDGDLYGRSLSIAFVDRLRQEQSFSSPEMLAHRMALDAEAARNRLADSVAEPLCSDNDKINLAIE